uniref:Peptidase_M13_N domain-containing protein n=1 Tax=Heterorhabditis bacteriophora TaxID=37862 RepID=A0A1I7X4E5_HETBA
MLLYQLMQQTEATLRMLNSLLSSTESDERNLKSVQFAQRLYSSCMNSDERTKYSENSLLDLLKNLPCGPILVGCNFNSETYKYDLLNDFVFYYLKRNPEEVQDMIDGVAQLMVDINKATQAMSSITPNTSYMTIAEFTKVIPQINIREMLNAELSSLYKWDESDIISIKNMDYFSQLANILSQTLPQTVANYLATVTGLNLRKYFYNINERFRFLKQQRNMQLAQIGTYMDIDDSLSYNILIPTIVYNPNIKSLAVPLSYLQSPISVPGENIPMHTIYGTLGVTIQQELAKQKATKIFTTAFTQLKAPVVFENTVSLMTLEVDVVNLFTYQKVTALAFFDTGSQVPLITEKFSNALDIQGASERTMSTAGFNRNIFYVAFRCCSIGVQATSF